MDQILGMGLADRDVEYVNDTTSHDRQLAGFFDATLKLTEKWKFDAGLRYAVTHFAFVNGADGPLNFGHTGGAGAEDERPATPKLTLSYQADAHNLFYLTASKGFRIGGANAPFPEALCQADLTALGLTSVPSSFHADTVTSFELGGRTQTGSGRMTTAFSLFQASWKDIQQSNYLSSCGFTYTQNLGEARSQGLDLETHISPTQFLRLDLRLGYTDARYSATKRTGASSTAPILVAKGDSLGAPRWTVAIGAQYDFELWNEAAFVRADFVHIGKDARAIPSRDPATESFDPFLTADPGVSVVNFRAGARVHHCDLAFFMDNALDAHPQLNVNHQDQYTLLLEATTLRPRTAGVSLSYDF
jgi:outer membrane receptor protein involved in Fe transport